MSYWKRAGLTTVVTATVLLNAVAYAGDITNTSNSNTGNVSNNSNDNTATTGANASIGKQYYYSAPSLTPAQGVDTVQAHSLFGGVTLSNTELDSRVKMKIEIIIDAYEVGLLTEKAAQARIFLALEDMDDQQKPRRVLFIGPQCRSRNLLNGLGLLCFD